VKHEMLGLGVERADGRVMADLLADHAITQLLSARTRRHTRAFYGGTDISAIQNPQKGLQWNAIEN